MTAKALKFLRKCRLCGARFAPCGDIDVCSRHHQVIDVRHLRARLSSVRPARGSSHPPIA